MILSRNHESTGALPIVSVILPVFNGEEFLSAACTSVLNQTLGNVELIIVDDGSTDSSLSIAKSIGNADSRVKVIPLGTNSGLPAVPRNVGIAEAKGRYVAFIDHDDSWWSRKLVRQTSALDKRHDFGMVHSYLWAWRGGNPFQGLRQLLPAAEKSTTYESLLQANNVQTSSVLIRKEVLTRLAGFSEEVKLRAIEDFDLWLRVVRRHGIGYIPEVHGSYRIRRTSISTTSDPMDRLRYLDETRGTNLSTPSHRKITRVVHRAAVTPAAVGGHLVSGTLRYRLGLEPKIL